ncbi:MAG: hypothetical protein B0D85_03010 [Candidatus Sedimenticola endophacoides]|uniref:Lipoprotein n=1 Tax=Candidatus Sedimenticola endophacoides TaxID=2548426 RepID=A0A657PN63_9GAMM|nr:MAG: hypothetical protein B0D84_03015 [Candidatus Sedimenticola endophacoides]OQX42699.1 MAG: hypothetical protein B0D89_00735 [Candidatus Sedimenticola endophacoides]OQX43750.1 MAG: hypothetical protein B0D83_00845 [Candidatus Sedimenticola endophacoides]OQX46674.1 MAG: hypothetical protein B0D86_01245 [Candidatus Sedimenticola endophacoides]OQX46795.1 MAG: hypothetical protein B0D85_03010 [Candidatus Sedimenticola endophacoides]
MRIPRLILVLTLGLSACDGTVSPPYLNYQDCKLKRAADYRNKGASQFKADLEARAECRALYHQ